MYALERALIDLDLDLLRVIADLWDVDSPLGESVNEAAAKLVAFMTQPQAVAETWSRLAGDERTALAALQAHEGRLPLAQFTRQFGEIRPMGTARREREKPWLEPANPTEALYYRGLIARAFDQGPGGVQEYIYVPRDLLPLLPAPAEGLTPAAPGQALEAVPPEGMLPASQTAPDDLTTLLAYFRLHAVNALDELAAPGSLPNLTRYLTNPDPAYEALLIHLAYELGLLANDEGGVTQPVADSAKPWLEAPRLHQLRSLGEAWRDSADWNDLSRVPGLVSDEWLNDPLATRRTLLEMLGRVPPGVWWSLASFLAAVKAENPDFQRPGGDYDRWYVRDAETDEVLHGFQNWQRVDGALVRWLLVGPLHWLGLLDLHPDVQGGAFRLTPSGAALLGLAPWPSEPDPEGHLSVDDQSLITVSPALSRIDRYLVARFAAWRDIPDPEADAPAYTYQMTPPSLQRAAEQGIAVPQILSFLKRTSARPVPRSVEVALAAWEEAGAEVVLHDVVVLAASDFGVYERLRKDPTVKRFLGKPLGPNIHAVARKDVPSLLGALRRMGLLPLFEDFPDDEAP